MTAWRNLTPSERVDVLAQRFRRSREAAWKANQTFGSDTPKHRARVARLEVERPDWLRLIWAHRGNVTAVARAMGYSSNTAYLAIGALGLRGEVDRARRATPSSEPPQRSAGLAPQDALAPSGRPLGRVEPRTPSRAILVRSSSGSDLTQALNWEAPWETVEDAHG